MSTQQLLPRNGRLTYDETAQLVGVSTETLRTWRRAGKKSFPVPYRIGLRLYFNRDEVEAFIETLRLQGGPDHAA
jgi:excisionase family DNA binding protein